MANNGKSTFFTLEHLAEVLSTKVDRPLSQASQGNLALCAETDDVNCRGHHWRLTRELHPDAHHTEWHEQSHIVRLSKRRAKTIKGDGKLELEEAHYPRWVNGSLKEGQVVYQDEIVVFENPCTVTTDDLLVLNGDAAIFYCTNQAIPVPATVPVFDPSIRQPKNADGKSIGGSYKIFPIAKEFLQILNPGYPDSPNLTESDSLQQIIKHDDDLNFTFKPRSNPPPLSRTIEHYLVKWAGEVMLVVLHKISTLSPDSSIARKR